MNDGAITISVFLFVVGFIALAIFVDVHDRRKWAAYVAANNCRVIGKMRGEFFNTFDGKNVGVGYTGDKTGWLCDDGQQYWR